MSHKLAISSTLSVLMMASYVLFGGDARQAGFAPKDPLLPQIAAAGLLPQASDRLPR